MSQNPIFVSYSRKEYFFTESLVLHLQRQHIDAWFDVQELEPGIGWKTDIQQGLNRCESLVLVASRASLASPYVKLEWQAALEAHKPVHVVFFEPIALPSELATPTSIIDFTQGFERSISLLVKVIQEHSSHCDPLPTARRLPAPVEQLSHLMRRRVALWWVLLAATLAVLAKSTVVLLTTGFAADPVINVSVYGFLLLVIGRVLYVLWVNRTCLKLAARFLKRENAPVALWFRASHFQASGALLTALLALPCVAVLQSAWCLVMLLPAFALLLQPVVRRRRKTKATPLLFNPDLLRWCHLGNDVPYDWRILLNQAVLPESMSAAVLSKKVTGMENEAGNTPEWEVVTGIYVSVKDARPSQKTYCLYATPQVKEVEQYIKTILQKNHFQEVQGEVSVPDYHIVLISPWTPIEATRTLIQNYPDSTLPVLVASSVLSSLPDISRLQLVDFRLRYEPALASALQYLHTPAAQERSVFSLSVLPVQLSSSAPVFELRSVQQMMLFMSSLSLFFGLIGLISLALPAISGIFQARPAIQSVLSALVYTLTLGGVWWLARSAREIGNLVPKSPRRLRLEMVSPVVLIGSTFVLGLQPHIAVNSAELHVRGVIGDELLWRGIGIVLLLLLSIVPVIHMELAIRRGHIAAHWQDVLGVPPMTFRFGALQILQFGLIALGYAFAYLVAAMISDLIAHDTGALCLFVFVVGIFALGGLAYLQGIMHPSVAQAEMPFVFKDAPSLRSYMKKVIGSRKNAAS